MPDPQPERGPLWTADAVAEACNGEWLVRPTDEWRPTTVSYDNTVIAKGCLLFCRNPWTWRSDAPNAALDLKRAAAQGCSAAVIQHEQRATLPPLPPDFPLLLVKNSRRAITDLGYAARARYKLSLIHI